MTMSRILYLPGRLVFSLLCILTLSGLSRLQAQPTIVSVNPVDGATGVSPSSPVVFTFSTPMGTNFTLAYFTNRAGSFLPVAMAWSGGNTVLTCTPAPSFPGGTNVYWFVIGFDPTFTPLAGTTTGSFITSGSGSIGNGTNAYTSFVLNKLYIYEQTSPAAPSPDTNAPYLFTATTAMASNRSPTSITLTIPTTGGVSNLTQNFAAPENWYFTSYDTNQARFESTFPQGAYTYNVMASASNQTLTVTLPVNMTQPNAPHVTNYTAAQAINSSSAFTLGWDPFTGGAGASNFVYVYITRSGTNLFQTGTPGASNALVGTAVTATIPANTLPAGGTFDATIGFYRTFVVTNDAVDVSSAFRASATQFTISTSSGTGGPLTLVNPRVINGTASFDITCSPGQMFTVLSATNAALAAAQWTVLLTTNSTGTSVHFVDPRPATSRSMFYRARNGS
jgi:hypothetical protein